MPLVSLHAHNEAARLPELLTRLGDGARVAVVSDAGMPGVSDPGARLVDAAHAAGFPVEVIPGPSAVTAAIAASGAPADRFAFAGFLAAQGGRPRPRCSRISTGWAGRVVAFESPQRLAGSSPTWPPRTRSAGWRSAGNSSKLYEETLVGSRVRAGGAVRGRARRGARSRSCSGREAAAGARRPTPSAWRRSWRSSWMRASRRVGPPTSRPGSGRAPAIRPTARPWRRPSAETRRPAAAAARRRRRSWRPAPSRRRRAPAPAVPRRRASTIG